jgi:SynChlorMet cassette protein ScmC
MSFFLVFIHRQVQERGGIPFHGALVEKEGRGVLLAGAGGAGKSTCCARLPPPWRAMGDDAALIVAAGNGSYRAHPLPTWSDLWIRGLKKSWPIESSVPLALILFIEQAPEDELVPVGRGLAAVRIAEAAGQATFLGYEEGGEAKRRLRNEFFDHAARCAQAVPSAILRVSPAGPFWEKIDEAMAP